MRTQVAPLTDRPLARLPDWTRQVHDWLLGAHLDRSLDADRTLDIARVTARVDYLPHRPSFSRDIGLSRGLGLQR